MGELNILSVSESIISSLWLREKYVAETDEKMALVSSFHKANTDFKAFKQRKTSVNLGPCVGKGLRASTQIFSFIIRNVSVFLQVQTTCS